MWTNIKGGGEGREGDFHGGPSRATGLSIPVERRFLCVKLSTSQYPHVFHPASLVWSAKLQLRNAMVAKFSSNVL